MKKVPHKFKFIPYGHIDECFPHTDYYTLSYYCILGGQKYGEYRVFPDDFSITIALRTLVESKHYMLADFYFLSKDKLHQDININQLGIINEH